MNRARNLINAPVNIYQYSGRGITAAVLDTGIERHPDLEERLVAFRDFVNFRDHAYDDSGHGTHVCGIIGGSGRLSRGRYCGVAPGVNLVVGKILDGHGDGSMEDMIRGIQWVLNIHRQYRIRILNISVGIGNVRDRRVERELLALLTEAWDRGIIVVCAAGNRGPASGSISSIGMSRKIITVGCHDAQPCNGRNCCAYYSGRGEALAVTRKPDIVAPGTNIVSCNAFFERRRNGIVDGYTMKSGTSMSTPMVSGAAALFLEKCPWCEGEEFKRRLTLTATDMGEPWNQQGWGMLNIGRMLEQM